MQDSTAMVVVKVKAEDWCEKVGKTNLIDRCS
jgi:hypothetical protein